MRFRTSRSILRYLLVLAFVASASSLLIGTVLAESMTLNVPYVSQTSEPVCVSASVTMILQYWGVKTTLHDVLGKIGLPPITLDRIQNAVESYGLDFQYISYSNIQQVEHWIDRGVPVMVQQVFSEDDLSGHMRIVVGYDDSQGVLFVNDGVYGPEYVISYARFATLWQDLIKYVYPRNDPNETYIITPKAIPGSPKVNSSPSPIFHIDGSGMGWNGYTPIIQLPSHEGKIGTPGTTLKSVYAVADSHYLYVMIETVGTPDSGDNFIFPLDLSGNGQWDYSIGFNRNSAWMYNLTGIPNGEFPDNRQTPPSGVYYAVAKVAEVAVPLSLIGNPKSITLQVWIYYPSTGQTVDYTGTGDVAFLPFNSTTSTSVPEFSSQLTAALVLGTLVLVACLSRCQDYRGVCVTQRCDQSNLIGHVEA
jgi:hypothetical protein